MDAERFDAVARLLRDSPSRRAVLSLGLGGLVAALSGLAETSAKKKQGKGKGKSKKKKKKGGNGARRANGQPCANRDNCAGAFCTLGTCQACVVDPNQCGADVNGGCFCDVVATGGPNVCGTRVPTGPFVTNCSSCPGGTHCVDVGSGQFGCYKLCGES